MKLSKRRRKMLVIIFTATVIIFLLWYFIRPEFITQKCLNYANEQADKLYDPNRELFKSYPAEDKYMKESGGPFK